MKECYFQPATLLNVTHLHGYFPSFLHCKNGTKLRNASYMINELINMQIEIHSIHTIPTS